MTGRDNKMRDRAFYCRLRYRPCLYPVSSVEGDGAPRFLFGRMVRFISEHSLLGATAAATLLSADSFDCRSLRGHKAVPELFDFIQQQASGEETVKPLLARALAFDLEASGPMKQHDARGCFIHVLPAMPARADEGFFQVSLLHPQGSHPLGQLGFLLQADGK